MKSSFTRRRFLQSSAIAAAATQLPLTAESEPAPTPWPENGTLIPDHGWRLWIDEHATWQNDDIFLPEDITSSPEGIVLAKGQPLPVNAPTGGWKMLTSKTGKEVLLPTTVEQHFWGKYGSRPYTPEEYRYAADTKGGTQPAAPPTDDDIPQNGAYFGVSWWHRAINIPAEMQGKRIFLHIRGARLRAEVYLNQQLVGYSIMEELPFECDLTHAAKPGGENHLAIRLTNPFGRFDWVDGLNAKWGKVNLYRSHGFGGLDRGMTISAYAHVRIKDAWLLNTRDPRTIEVFIEIDGEPNAVEKTKSKFGYQLSELAGDKMIIQSLEPIFVDGKWLPSDGKSKRRIMSTRITLPTAKLWDLSNHHLYELAVFIPEGEGLTISVRALRFGFRSFAPTGIGTNAMFRLNGKRIRIYSSISWGFWGLNGMFPVPELAEKEVTQAKKLGLNCLNFHRNLAKEDVLRAHDRLGLLRYLEPGAGKLAIGKLPEGAAANSAGVIMAKPTSEADLFAQRYMFTKCVEMVKAYRSHPSVIEYCLQNEIGADLKNPATLAILKAMHDEDPSRCVVLNDGFVAPPRKAAQAWYEPWNEKLHRSDETAWGDWWNQHQGAGDQWYDEFYKSPTDFTYKAPFKEVLTEFGEMEGCARPDNHSLMLHQITETYKQYGGAGGVGTSYDLADHREIVAAYEAFLTKWKFRAAFPTAESVFTACGKTCYESWANYLENARISDELDFAVVSGWESTSIENHSGIVDNLRNFKADPKLIGDTLLPIRPIAKQRSLVIEQGKTAMFDLYLANDTGKPVTGTLTFSVVTPRGHKFDLKQIAAPPQTPDVFSYLLAEAFETPKLTEEGLYRFKFSISSQPLATQTREIWVTRSPIGLGLPLHHLPGVTSYQGLAVAISGISPALRKQLSLLPNLAVEDFDPAKMGYYDVILSSGLTSHTTTDQNVGETTGETNPINAVQTTTQQGHLQQGILEAVAAGTPLLCLPQADSLSDGCAAQLAAAGAFSFHGNVGDFRAPWMGNWYFVRDHALFAGMPVNQAMGGFYQAKGRQSNGLLVDGPNVDVVVGYSRDHDRKIGAGTFTTKLGKGKILYHRVPDLHPVLQQRFLANALGWLTT